MVGTQEEQIVTPTNLVVEIVKKVGNSLVKSQIRVFSLHCVRSHLMTDIVGTGTTYRQQVRHIATAQAFTFDSSLSHVESKRVAIRSVLDNAIAVLLVQYRQVERQCGFLSLLDAFLVSVVVVGALRVRVFWIKRVPLLRQILGRQFPLVEVVNPFGQLVHVVCARYEISRLIVKPKRAVGIVSGGQYGCTVFKCHANHFGLAVGGNLHFVANGSDPQIARRHLSCLACSANWFHGTVVRTVHFLSVLHEFVSCNAVYRRYATCIYAGVTDGCDRRHIRQARVFTRKALSKQSFETTVTVATLIAVQIVPPHLVYHNAYYKSWTGCLCANTAAHHQQCHNGKSVYLSHFHGLNFVVLIFLQRYCRGFSHLFHCL